MKKTHNTKQTIQELSHQKTQTDHLGSVTTGANSSLDTGGFGGISFLPPYGGGTFCEAKGGGAFGRGTGRKAFTLVELIIVITILAILATIAFISFQGYTSKSRDANRASTAKNIETGLSVFQAKSGVYPIQSTGGTISLSGTPLTVQGNLDESIARVINLSEVPRDPKTGEMYHYISDTAGRGGKVLYYLENTPDYAFLTQSFAESEARTPIVKGEGPGVVFQDDELVSEGTKDFFGADSGASFTILVDDTTKVTGSGLELGGGFQMFALKGGRLEAPRTCPEGFIAVPGNAEFMQPGFCVAKYEMALERDLVGTGELNYLETWNTRKGTSSSTGTKSTSTVWKEGKIVSAPGKYPIAYTTQIQAIAACKSIQGHLVLNNEWMTIARNIEANGENWSSGKVGSGYIATGNSNGSNGCLASEDLDGDGLNTQDIFNTLPLNRAVKTGPGGVESCDLKRQLKLSNGEIIWDLSGNLREMVNPMNTLNGEFASQMPSSLCNVTLSGSYQYGVNTANHCNFINPNFFSQIGPKITTLDTSNGIGNIWTFENINVTYNKMYIRGGRTVDGDSAGIYKLNVIRGETTPNHTVGFRCAY